MGEESLPVLSDGDVKRMAEEIVKYTTMPEKDRLKTILPILFYCEPFFGDIFRYLNKIPTLSIPTLAVGINLQGELCFWYNPHFTNSLSFSMLYFGVKHETYHILLSHIFERARKPNDIWNIAIDTVTNELILLDMEIHRHGFEKSEFNFKIDYYEVREEVDKKYCSFTKLISDKNFKEYAQGEYNKRNKNQYYGFDYFLREFRTEVSGYSSEKLFDLLLENQVGQGGFKIFDIHGKAGTNQESGSWVFDDEGNPVSDDEISGQEKDEIGAIAKEKFKKQLKDAIQEARARDYGSTPAHLQKLLDEFLKGKEIDWKKLLSYFIKTTIRGHRYATVRKVNKRFPYLYPGIRHRKYAKVLIGIDESGSMSDELITLLFTEIARLSELVQFDVISFDTSVAKDSLYTWKKGRNAGKHQRKRCGGTCFDHISKYAAENKYDGLIIATDLQAPMPASYHIRRMWFTSEDNKKENRWIDGKRELIVAVKEKKLK